MKDRIKRPLTNFQRKKAIIKAHKLLDSAEYHVDQIILAAQEAEENRGKYRQKTV